jgi:hypothetical protein
MITMVTPLYHGEAINIFGNIVNNFKRQFLYRPSGNYPNYTPNLIVVDDRYTGTERYWESKKFSLPDTNEEMTLKYVKSIDIDVFVENEEFIRHVVSGDEFLREYAELGSKVFGNLKASLHLAIEDMLRKYRASFDQIRRGIVEDASNGQTSLQGLSADHSSRFAATVKVPFDIYQIQEVSVGTLGRAQMILLHLNYNAPVSRKRVFYQLMNIPESMPIGSEVIRRPYNKGIIDPTKFQFRNLGIKRNIGIQVRPLLQVGVFGFYFYFFKERQNANLVVSISLER